MNYWQELKTKRSNRKKNNSSYENRDSNSRFSSGTSGLSNIRPGENSSGNISLEESGSANSRKKQNKSFQKQQSSHKQRFFSSIKNHGTGRNSLPVISESPPSNSVGFFFSSTPPENNGSDCCLGFWCREFISSHIIILLCSILEVIFLLLRAELRSYIQICEPSNDSV